MKGATYILGISGLYHDSAACLLRDGDIVAAAQEERFSRVKGDARFPERAIAYCLAEAGIDAGALAHVVFYDKPLLKARRLLATYLGIAPRGFRQFAAAVPLWTTERLLLERDVREGLGYERPILFAEHHESHAASAFYPSPFDEAAILTIDGVGEWATASIGYGRGADLELRFEVRWPDSLGLLYSAFTQYLGFKVNSGEYKVMGLAPYGRPAYVQRIFDSVVDLREDGSFVLDQRYFDYLGGTTMTSPAFHALFGGPPRHPESLLTQRDMDLARSVQAVCEEIVLRMSRTAHRTTGSRDLCLAGGVALNCVANGRVLREGPFERVWVQPAAGDAGGALGAAMLAWHRECGASRRPSNGDRMRGAFLGPAYGPDEVESCLRGAGAVYERLPREALLDRVAALLADGRVVGWHNGRMEFGPRALGARSILADPRGADMQTRLNLKIKFRESFRPFAPSVLREHASRYFDLEVESPYMLLVSTVRPEWRVAAPELDDDLWGIDLLNVRRSEIPAVTHVDYSARVQTVDGDTNADYHDLLQAFERLTGCPVLVNTSFNVRGEPIVCTPADAYRCFMRTDIDNLVVGEFLLDKAAQPAWDDANALVPLVLD